MKCLINSNVSKVWLRLEPERIPKQLVDCTPMLDQPTLYRYGTDSIIVDAAQVGSSGDDSDVYFGDGRLQCRPGQQSS
jgi:hypothetical protein